MFISRNFSLNWQELFVQTWIVYQLLERVLKYCEKQTTPTLQGSYFLSPALACRNLSPVISNDCLLLESCKIFYKEFIQNEYYSNHRGHVQFFQQCNIKRERERLRVILVDPLEAVVVASVHWPEQQVSSSSLSFPHYSGSPTKWVGEPALSSLVHCCTLSLGYLGAEMMINTEIQIWGTKII